MGFWHTLVARWRAVDRAALVTAEEAISFRDLVGRVERAAGWLRSHGLGPGDVLALQMDRELAFLELHLAALGLGVATLPMNPAYTGDEIGFLLGDAKPRLAVLLEPGAGAVAAADVRAALDAATPVPLEEEPAEEAIACILYTSGTTGRPKGARITHANLGATVRALHEAWRWREDDVLVHALPLFHVHGLFVAQHGALFAGARTVWLPRFEARAALEALVAHRGTVFMGVPTFYTRFLGLPADERFPLDHVRLFTCGSAPLPARVHQAFAARFGHAILERYGMTEVGIVLSNPYDGERRPGAVGFPVPGAEVRVVDPESGAELPRGAIGEIRVRGASVCAGYLDRPEATREAMGDGWMHTGDLGCVDPDGWFRVVGRARELIITGGLNVYPAEVEAALTEHPDVAEAAVVGVPDPDLGERVVAAVVARPGRHPAESEVRAHARAHLAPYKCPKEVRVLDALPRNAMGKVQKELLRRGWTMPVVRDARPDEADRIAAWNVAMAGETEDLALDAERVRRGTRAVFERDVGARYFVAELDGEPAGQCMITVEWSDWRDRYVWWLQSVYVHPDFRRRGVYRALHDHVIERADAAGAGGLRLYVDRRNRAAMEVYRRVGMDGEHYRVFEVLFDYDPSAPEEG